MGSQRVTFRNGVGAYLPGDVALNKPYTCRVQDRLREPVETRVFELTDDLGQSVVIEVPHDALHLADLEIIP